MNLQDYLTNAVAAGRKARLDQSDQMTLGELIAKLEPIAARQAEIVKKYDGEAEVQFDFEYLFPTRFSSWRGIYAELALEFAMNRDDKQKPMTVSEFLDLCKRTIGETFEGWKGGDYKMGKTTPIWVANPGNSGNTALIEVVDNEYTVILITGYRES